MKRVLFAVNTRVIARAVREIDVREVLRQFKAERAYIVHGKLYLVYYIFTVGDSNRFMN